MLLHRTRETGPGGTAPGAGGSHPWERLADAVVYGTGAFLGVLLAVRQVVGGDGLLPDGDGRGLVLGLCGAVGAVVALGVARRR